MRGRTVCFGSKRRFHVIRLRQWNSQRLTRKIIRVIDKNVQVCLMWTQWVMADVSHTQRPLEAVSKCYCAVWHRLRRLCVPRRWVGRKATTDLKPRVDTRKARESETSNGWPYRNTAGPYGRGYALHKTASSPEAALEMVTYLEENTTPRCS